MILKQTSIGTKEIAQGCSSIILCRVREDPDGVEVMDAVFSRRKKPHPLGETEVLFLKDIRRRLSGLMKRMPEYYWDFERYWDFETGFPSNPKLSESIRRAFVKANNEARLFTKDKRLATDNGYLTFKPVNEEAEEGILTMLACLKKIAMEAACGEKLKHPYMAMLYQWMINEETLRTSEARYE
jgi:hypothetical protein